MELVGANMKAYVAAEYKTFKLCAVTDHTYEVLSKADKNYLYVMTAA